MTSFVYYGSDWCPDCVRVKRWLSENNLTDYTERDPDDGQEIVDEMLAKTNGHHEIPTLDINGKILVNPSNEELKEEFKTMSAEHSEDKIYDVVGIGAGPTSLAAAIYTTREDLETVLLEKGVVGGLAAVTESVENYPGFPDGVGGMELAQNLEKQALRFGTTIQLAEVTAIEDKGDYRVVKSTDGDYKAKTVLIGTGSDYKKAGVKGEKEFYGRGVHYCATCDGALYRDQVMAVIGGGNSAAQESLFLTKFAKQVHVFIRKDHWRASDVLIQKVQENDKITVHFNTEIEEIQGEGVRIHSITTKNNQTNETQEMNVGVVFVFVGLSPNTAFLGDSVELDEAGFVKTNEDLQTNLNGVFAAGDVRSGATMQIASAVGEGATAALKIREFLEANE
ncbi:TPA: thioredoxin-disulfide reductase [Candidatus Saccharibacteria bacterium]|nr:thioredoxin-disulfide reductase [Candidatus Saccharibacteria bacterium]HIO87469.1 thioredoxin-disulfide reductase [Candidatus Saccharibacteria bacterium]